MKKRKGKYGRVPSNEQIAEWLASEADRESHVRQRALRRAARSAFLWPEEVRDLIRQNRSLTELAQIGPYLEIIIRDWIVKQKRPDRPPPVRKEFLSIARSRAQLIRRPGWSRRFRGDLHMHTCWSDGSGEIREMAEAAKARDYEYIAITDHAKGLSIANGLNETRLAKQAIAIEKVNRVFEAKRVRFRVLRSIELNISLNGNGDLEPAVLRNLDLVLGSFHSALRRTTDQTERYLAALRNPDIQILGHPRGRIYNYRLGLTADWKTVFEEAARLDKAIEIDCYPDRQDLNLSLLKVARRAGTRISMGSDAHHPWQLEFIDLALAAALAAKISPDRIVNFLSLEKLLSWVQKVRKKSCRKRSA